MEQIMTLIVFSILIGFLLYRERVFDKYQKRTEARENDLLNRLTCANLTEYAQATAILSDIDRGNILHEAPSPEYEDEGRIPVSG